VVTKVCLSICGCIRGIRIRQARGERGQPAGGRVPVHPPAVPVEQQRPADPIGDGAIDRAGDRRRQGCQHGLAAFAPDFQHPMAVLLAQVGDVRAARVEDPQAEQTQQAHQREVIPFAESRAELSSASNCRWVNPGVGESAGTAGRRTYSAGACASTPSSMTQVR